MIGEAASRSSLELPGRQLELLQAVVATGTPVVLLVMNGRPLDLRWAAEHVPAILDIWYPGTQGGAAVANLLFGDVSPGGKLPFTWPRTVGQVPMVYSHTRSHEPREPGQPLLGRGEHAAVPVRARPQLRDASSYAELAARPRRRSRAGEHADRVGGRSPTAEIAPADEVVQLYIHQRHGSASRPVRELKGFERVSLAAGGVAHGAVHAGAGGAALLERGGAGLGDRRLDLRRLGRRRLDGGALDELPGGD